MLRRMRTYGERLRFVRKRADYDTASDAARAYGWKISTYVSHENGIRVPKRNTSATYARAFRVSAAWLLTGEGIMTPDLPVPVVGYIGAGETVIAVDDHAKGAGLDMVERPVGVPSEVPLVAVKIKGDSMRPLKEGWFIYFSKDADGVASDCLNELCVVRLADGRTLLKELRRGYTLGRYNLHSWAAGADVIEDVEVEWATRVRSIVPP